MYKPMMLNDLECQKLLWDRRKVYSILRELEIPQSRHFFVNRDKEEVTQEQLEGRFGINSSYIALSVL